jgi:hypothetical protein
MAVEWGSFAKAERSRFEHDQPGFGFLHELERGVDPPRLSSLKRLISRALGQTVEPIGSESPSGSRLDADCRDWSRFRPALRPLSTFE